MHCLNQTSWHISWPLKVGELANKSNANISCHVPMLAKTYSLKGTYSWYNISQSRHKMQWTRNTMISSGTSRTCIQQPHTKSLGFLWKYSQHQRLSLGDISRCIQLFTTWIMNASIAASSILSASTCSNPRHFLAPFPSPVSWPEPWQNQFSDTIIRPKYLGLQYIL